MRGMSRPFLPAALCAGALVASLVSCGLPGEETSAVVARVADGDTLTLTNGSRVRLVQIDAPELAAGECWAEQARRELLRLAPVGSSITLEDDPALDRVDRNGRLLRYVLSEGTNVNVTLVRRGAAAPYFFRGERGRYAGELLGAALAARREGRGLWGAAPRTDLEPSRQVDTGRCASR
jgi:endonuclease YncB( thermonuclease family)